MQRCSHQVMHQLCRSLVHPSPLMSALPTLFAVQTRNTHVVKHYKVKKLQVHHPEMQPDPCKAHKLTDERYIYERIRFESVLKPKPIDVLLLRTVEGVGMMGDVVSMSPGKARKNLLLPKLAVYASPENIEKYVHLKYADHSELPSSIISQRTVDYLGGAVITVCVNMDVPWTLELWHLQVAFRKAAVHISEQSIQMPDQPISGPNFDYEKKFFYVTVTLNAREKVRVRCAIHHVSGNVMDRKRLPPTTMDFLKEPPQSVLPSQEKYLTALHNQRCIYTKCTEPQLTEEQVIEGITRTTPYFEASIAQQS